MSAPETAAATAEQVKPTEAPITSKDPVVRTVVTALRRVLKHTVIQETPKEEAKTEVRLSSSFVIQLFLTPSLQQDPAPAEDPAPAAEPTEPAAEAPAEEAKPVSPPNLTIHAFHPRLTLH